MVNETEAGSLKMENKIKPSTRSLGYRTENLVSTCLKDPLTQHNMKSC